MEIETIGEAEARDTRALDKRPALVIFVGVPERAIVDRVDTHAGVVSPAPAAKVAGSVDDGLFSSQGARGVARNAARIANTWVYARTGHAVPDGKVARLVHSDAPHKPELGVRGADVRGVRALLDDSGSPAKIPQLIPPNPYHGSGLHRVVDHQCLVVSKVPVRQTVHQPVTERLDEGGRSQLRGAGCGCEAGRLKAGHGDTGWPNERRGVGNEVSVELPH